jgi:hypothetical protein
LTRSEFAAVVYAVRLQLFTVCSGSFCM